GYITLTESGFATARMIYERHVLISNWLISIGVDEKVAREDACRVEHALSKESFEIIKEHAKNEHPDIYEASKFEVDSPKK
ncbi:MAG: metal-dependent transcriptional regulator, partial [[Eubacterium] sulci]|nr:metal-dependent transcriptional regulator [[Eubacterium] sulci]